MFCLSKNPRTNRVVYPPIEQLILGGTVSKLSSSLELSVCSVILNMINRAGFTNLGKIFALIV